MSPSILRRLLSLLCLPAAVLASPPADGTFTVISFGDSTTASRKNVEPYTFQLAQRFKSAAAEIRFINRGVPDDNTDRARARLKTDILDDHPSLVIVQFGLNDSAIDVWKTPPAEQPRISLKRYEENLTYFVTEIRRSGADVVLMTPNQLRWSPVLREKYGRPPYDLNDERGMTRPVAAYAEVVRQIAARLKVTLVDVYAAYDDWEQRHHESCSSLMLDGTHPNTQGHALVTDALEPIIAGALRRPSN